jgi:hypothetical protein
MVDGSRMYTVFPDGRTEVMRLRDEPDPELASLQSMLRLALQPDGEAPWPVLPIRNDGRGTQALRSLGYTEGEDH